MQSKGAIRFIAIAFAIVCLYQLSFTWKVRQVENQAKEFAKGDSSIEHRFLDSVKGEPVYNLGIQKYTYNECKEREINLGLDLKGGMNVTLEVSIPEIVRALANNSIDPTFNKALSNAVEKEKSSQKDFVTLFGEEFQKLDPNARLSALFSNAALQDKVSLNSTNDEVLKIIKKEADDAFESTYKILRTRIDKFGVAQPNIQKLTGSGRIMVELPGVKDKDRVRKLLQGTAKLEFWETFNLKEIYPDLTKADAALRSIIDFGKDSTGGKDSAAVAVGKDSTNKDKKVAAGKDTTKKDSSKLALAQTLNKADTGSSSDTGSTAFKTADAARKNPLFFLLFNIPPKTNEEARAMEKSPIMGSCMIKDTAKVNSYLAMPSIKSLFPAECKFLWTVKPSRFKDKNILELIAIKIPGREGKAKLEGDAIVDAAQDFGQMDHRPEITMEMNPDGANTWRRMTAENKDRSIAIVLDDYVYSYPNVINEIPNGRSSITGNFEVNEAKDLANILKAGKLPAPAKIVEESIVGPSLGAEAINNSLVSFIIAFIVILLFMGWYYMRAGLVANIALFTNIFFMMGVLASLGAVLTLPGIAGIVLTIGLAVDANILIFERVREELRGGKGVRLAISDGFKHAMSSILDSNLTLLILGIVLYVFGSGPVQGFATTLVIGVCTSLFSAILISRMIFETLLARNIPISFGNKISENVYKNIHFNFVDNRKKFYVISAIIILGGIVSFAFKGLNFGVDFKGGHTYTIQMDKPLTTENVRLAMKPLLNNEAPEVKSVGTDNRFKVTTSYLINDTSREVETVLSEKLYAGLKPMYNKAPDYESFKNNYIISSQKVGPTIANDIKTSAVWAILISCGLMFLYIFFRFKKWQYGLGATVALFHDVLIVLSVFAIFNGILPIALEIDQHFIAAILTVMGYTMTESVVVFDRIREYLSLHHTDSDEVVINKALNATLSRTINTTLTVFFVLIVIFIFGGEVIRGFIFALLVGRVIGTYSSLCISTPIVIDFASKKQKAVAGNAKAVKA